jgi:hypothetical protein
VQIHQDYFNNLARLANYWGITDFWTTQKLEEKKEKKIVLYNPLPLDQLSNDMLNNVV